MQLAPNFQSWLVRWQSVILALACLLAFLPGLAALPPTDRDESRYVQATKQMLETGDYIDIRNQETPRYKKPIGIYWLQTVAVKLTGQGPEAEVYAYRLASVAAGVVAVVTIASLGSFMFGPLAGFAAGLLLLGLLGLGIEARLAKTDATLLAFTLVAQSALARFYLLPRQGEAIARRWWWIFWLGLSAGILVKGPITPLVLVLTLAGILIFDKDRAWLRNLKPLRGLLLLILVVVPWFLAITIKSGGAFWVESVGRDLLGKVATGQESHGAPPGYYMITYSLYMWPFGLLAIHGGLKALNRFREPKLLFLLSWYIPLWIFFELVSTKLPHYTLPAYPALLLLGAWALFTPDGRETTMKVWQVWVSRLTLFGLAVVTLLLVGLSTFGVAWLTGNIVWQGFLVAALALAAGYLASGLGRPEMSLGRLVGATAASLGFGFVFTGLLVPYSSNLFVSAKIEAAFNANKTCPDSILASAKYHEPSLVFLIGTNTILTGVPGAADHLKNGGECAVAVVPASQITQLQEYVGSQTLLEEMERIDGINYSNGDSMNLLLVRLAR